MDSSLPMHYHHLYPRGEPLIIAAPSVPPYATPALTANLFFRVFLGILSSLICIVPLRLLWRHGEFAAVLFILTVEVKSFETIANSLIWRDDNVAEWWPGYGLCDISAFLHNFLLGLYSTCLLAIVRSLTHQVSLLRASPLSSKERRQRNYIQALIIFPLPLVQLGFTWFLTAQRYAIGTLVGCSWVGYGSWPYLVFFILAPVVVALLTAGYAIFMYFRFSDIAKSSETAFSRNRLVSIRAQRTRRRLYLMVVSIMVPFLPIVIAFAVDNVMHMGKLKPFDYDAIHNHAYPYPWNSIFYITSDQINFASLNTPYISMFTSVPIFVFFGMTKDAMNDYRRILLFLGMGRLFPNLHKEYDPDRSAYESTLGSSQLSTGSSIAKFRSMVSTQELSTLNSRSGSIAPTVQHIQSPGQITPIDVEAGHVQRPRAVVASRSGDHISHPTYHRPEMQRNPFLFRATLDVPIPFRLSFFRSSKPDTESLSVPLVPLRSARSNSSIQPGISTRVWSDEEARLCTNSTIDTTNNYTSRLSTENGVIVETLLTRKTECKR